MPRPLLYPGKDTESSDREIPMKAIVRGIVIGLALTPLAANADSVWSDKAVKYRGEVSAIAVCKSVVIDDPELLQKLLRRYSRTLTSPYQYDLTSQQVAGAFYCNDLALLPFADEIGAQKVSNYLRKGIVTVEEFVSATN